MKTPKQNGWDVWDEEITTHTDFSKIIRKIKTYWPLSVLCAGVLMVFAFLYLYKTSPVYNVSASILIQDNEKKAGSGGGFISSLQDIGLLRVSDNVHNEQMIITSYPLVEKVVTDMQLFMQFSVKERMRNVSLYKNDLPFQVDMVGFDAEKVSGGSSGEKYQIEWADDSYTVSTENERLTGKWNVPLQLKFGKLVLQKNDLTAQWPRDRVVTMYVMSETEITDRIVANLSAGIPNKQTNIINLSLQTTTPQMGVDVLNALIASYQSSTVNDNNKLNDSTLTFINQRLLIVGNELDSIEIGIQNFKQKNQLTNLLKQSDVLVENLSKKDQELNAQVVQLSMIEALIDHLDENKQNPRVIPASLIVHDQTLTQAVESYNRLLTSRERFELSATSENPIVKNIDDQLNGLQKSIRSGLETIKSTLAIGIEKVRQQSNSLTGMMREVPAVEREFGNFNRQQTIKRDLYLFLLQKREESLLAKSSTIANSRIIGPARASKNPIKPKRHLILLSSVLIGLFLPFGYDRVLNIFNTKIRTKDEIKAITNLPIVGEIGCKKDEEGVILPNNSRTLIAEQFRALRTNLQFLLTQDACNTILITSATSGEGKTFVSSNLASIFGLTDKRIVLLEMDLRRPQIMKNFGLRARKGFSQYVIGKAELEEIVIPSKINSNVFIVPAGTIPPNPSELLLHHRTQELFLYLKEHFDLIIIDTTPALVSDAHLLAKYADATLYILRVNHTEKDQLKQMNSQELADKLPRLNLVVNGIKPKQYGNGSYNTEYYDYAYFQPNKSAVSLN